MGGMRGGGERNGRRREEWKKERSGRRKERSGRRKERIERMRHQYTLYKSLTENKQTALHVLAVNTQS